MKPTVRTQIAESGAEVLALLDTLVRLTSAELARPDAGQLERLEETLARREEALARVTLPLERLAAAARDSAGEDRRAAREMMGRVDRATRELRERDAELMHVVAARMAEISAELERTGVARTANAAYGGSHRVPQIQLTR